MASDRREAADAKAPATATTEAKRKKPATQAKHGDQQADKTNRTKGATKAKPAERPGGLNVDAGDVNSAVIVRCAECVGGVPSHFHPGR
jgi:hypothetical protein